MLRLSSVFRSCNKVSCSTRILVLNLNRTRRGRPFGLEPTFRGILLTDLKFSISFSPTGPNSSRLVRLPKLVRAPQTRVRSERCKKRAQNASELWFRGSELRLLLVFGRCHSSVLYQCFLPVLYLSENRREKTGPTLIAGPRRREVFCLRVYCCGGALLFCMEFLAAFSIFTEVTSIWPVLASALPFSSTW
jgi:hypothetical protein